jgi:hypothetical protein
MLRTLICNSETTINNPLTGQTMEIGEVTRFWIYWDGQVEGYVGRLEWGERERVKDDNKAFGLSHYKAV